MNNAVEIMLAKYNCHSQADYINALKEIFQEIALLGLWRAKFFEKAAFYGGTALRILYGLDRFSEDMDFSLLAANEDFSLAKYNDAIVTELAGFGFDVTVTAKNKDTKIESAFIKANTIKQLISIEAPETIAARIHRMNTIKIKMEVDTLPPLGFTTEVRSLLLPIPFSVLSFSQPNLFSGKLHALLCRQWQRRIKGRDWYDYFWYVSRNIPVNLYHLEQRLRQSGHWQEERRLEQVDLLQLLNEKISQVDFELAKADVIDFLQDKDAVALWSTDFFKQVTSRLSCVSEGRLE